MQNMIRTILKPRPHWRRSRSQQKVVVFGDKLSPFLATMIAVFGDYSCQCGWGFRKRYEISSWSKKSNLLQLAFEIVFELLFNCNWTNGQRGV